MAHTLILFFDHMTSIPDILGFFSFYDFSFFHNLFHFLHTRLFDQHFTNVITFSNLILNNQADIEVFFLFIYFFFNFSNWVEIVHLYFFICDPSTRFLVFRHACSLLSAICPNFHSRPFNQILWIILILFNFLSLFLLGLHWFISFICTQPFDQKIRSLFIYLILCGTQPFDQNLGSSLICFFYMHTTKRPKYMIFFHLFFLLCTTIRPKVRVLID